MGYNRRELAFFATSIVSLFEKEGIESMQEMLKLPKKKRVFSNGDFISISQRLYDYGGEICNRLDYMVRGSKIASPLIIEINKCLRFTVESDRLIKGYTIWTRTDDGFIVQRKTLESADIFSIFTELKGLSLYEI